MKSLPKNLNLFSMYFPLTAIVSILHRVSGVVLLFILPLFIWLLGLSLTASGFSWLQEMLSQGWIRFLLWCFFVPLVFHLVAGIRHLLMDFSIGISQKGGFYGSRLVFVLSAILVIFLGVYLW